MSKPTFVCIHGAWHSPSCFDGIKSMLSTYGYDCVCPSLPSVGGNPPTDDFTEDVTAIKSTVEELVNVKDVIVVMHSYSGIPGGQALEGLDKKSCVEKGLKGGVVRLVYMMAFIVPEGFQHSPKGARDNMVPSMKTDFKAGIVTVDPKGTKDLLYQDLSDEDVEKWTTQLRPQSIGVYWSTTTYAAWRHIPTTYVVCKKDVPSTVAAAEWLLKNVQDAGNHKIDTVVTRDVGHSLFLSQAAWTVSMLREAAGEKLE